MVRSFSGGGVAEYRLMFSIGALLVARQGRDECDDLARLLEPWDGTFSVLWRKRVARHVDGCDTCEEHRRGVPAAVLGAIGEFPAYLIDGRPLLDRVLTLVSAYVAYYLYLAYAEGIVSRAQRGVQAPGLRGMLDDLMEAAPFVPSGPFAILPMTGQRSSIVWAAESGLAAIGGGS